MSDLDLFVVEVDNFDGEDSSIAVTNSAGVPIRAVYCIARRDDQSGVLQFVDYGYASISDARKAWPHVR